MASLRAKGKKGGKGSGTQSGKKLTRKAKQAAILDLDNSDDDDDDDSNEGGLMEKERKSIEELRQRLSKCQLCGPTKFCKIGKGGQHVALTFNQLRGWALALVILIQFAIMTELHALQASGTHQVTLHTPPKGDLFAVFHSDHSSTAVPGPSTTTNMPPMPMIGPPGGVFNPYAFMPPPWFMPSGAAPLPYPATPVPQPSLIDTTPSSDPFDDIGPNHYPETLAFFTMLDQKHPRRKLLQCGHDFEQMDFYHINEIAKISAERLSSAEFGLTAGNAQFISETLKAEVKRIDRMFGKKSQRL
jgi:hypothetical protein